MLQAQLFQSPWLRRSRSILPTYYLVWIIMLIPFGSVVIYGQILGYRYIHSPELRSQQLAVSRKGIPLCWTEDNGAIYDKEDEQRTMSSACLFHWLDISIIHKTMQLHTQDKTNEAHCMSTLQHMQRFHRISGHGPAGRQDWLKTVPAISRNIRSSM